MGIVDSSEIMQRDYQSIYSEFKIYIEPLKALLITEDDLYAEFLLPNGWLLSIECERNYGPSFSIEIKNKSYGSFSVWLLMKSFCELKGHNYGNLTIKNQIDFILKEGDVIFGSVPFYKDKYEKINAL